jgi:hypothetical protein
MSRTTSTGTAASVCSSDRRLHRFGAPTIAQHLPYLQREGIRHARLHQETIAVCRERLLLHGTDRMAGQHDDPRVHCAKVRSQSTRELETRTAWEPEVGHDHVGTTLAGTGESIFGVGRADWMKALRKRFRPTDSNTT